jgi:hypothetical protein
MAVYVIAAVLVKPLPDGNSVVKPFMRVILMNVPDTKKEAVDFMKTEFSASAEAKDGWTMAESDPVMFELHQGFIDKWGDMIGPAPVIPKWKGHLTVVS